MRRTTIPLLIIFALLAATGCESQIPADGGGEPAVAAEPTAVRTVRVQTETVPGGSTYNAALRPRRSAKVSSKVMAQVNEVFVAEGDRVEQGELLVELDDRRLRAELLRAQAGLSSAGGATSQAGSSVQEARAAVRAAESNYRLAKDDAERFENLYDKDSVSKQRYQQMQTKLDAARSELERAREKLDQAQAGVTRAESGESGAAARVEAARVMLSYTEIRAPWDGVVTRKLLDAGNMAKPGAPLLAMHDTSRLHIYLEVPESAAGKISQGDRLTTTVDNYPGGPLQPEVVSVVPAVDPASHTLTVKLAIEPRDGLKPGMYARVQLPDEAREELVLPGQAVIGQAGPGEREVFRVSEAGRVNRIPVTLTEAGEKLRVVKGLSVGDRLVLDPPEGLSDGDPVQLQDGGAE